MGDETEPTRLNPQVVHDTFTACYDKDGEVEVEGVMVAGRLNKARLADHAELIAALLLELPDEFRDGWSFLNACMDRHGNQWTGEHHTMDLLFMLGQGIGMVTCPFPRDMWPALYGGMPYYAVKASVGDQPFDWDRDVMDALKEGGE